MVAMDGLNSDDAVRALRRLRAQGYELDPQNSEHVRARMTLRANAARVDGRRWVAHLGSTKTDGLAMRDLCSRIQTQRNNMIV